MEKTVADLRMELAEWGIELKPDDMQDILQAAAHIASFIGGSVTIDSGSFWGLYVEIDSRKPGECWVDLVEFGEDDEEDDIPEEELN